MSTLYEINGELLQLLSQRDELDEQSFRDTWEALELERADKIENVLSYVKDLRLKASGCKAEADNLAQRAKVYSNRADSLMNYLQLQLSERERYESARHKLTWRSTTSVEVSCEPHELPEQFQRVTLGADKKALKEALESGVSIAGVEIVNKLNMNVK
jgi:uncharacterized coiled-coil DUF342 family protein